MHCDRYRRLYAVCLIMAERSKQPDERARWFTLAQDCLGRENRPRAEARHGKCAEDHWKLKLTGRNSHAAAGSRAA